MEPILSFKEVLDLLKNNQIVFTLVQKSATFFALQEDNVIMQNKALKTLLSIEDFVDLFRQNTFYLYEKVSGNEEIDLARDKEYYSWKHK